VLINDFLSKNQNFWVAYIAHKIAFDAFKMATQTPNYNRIKAVLAEQDKTNLWLAEKLDMNKSTVSKWCTNDIQPTIETLFKIAKALDVDVRELLVSTK
jgi:DNA-binding XRE family transcriptional regulator